LPELGATPFYKNVFADDAVGLENFVDEWIELLWPAVEKVCKHSSGAWSISSNGSISPHTSGLSSYMANVDKMSDLRLATPSPTLEIATGTFSRPGTPKRDIPRDEEPIRLDVSTLDVGDATTTLTGIPKLAPCTLTLEPFVVKEKRIQCVVDAQDVPAWIHTPNPVVLANIAHTERLSAPTALKKTLYMTLDVSSRLVEAPWVEHMQPGDAIGMVCKNSSHHVSQILRLLEVRDADAPVKVTALSPDIQLPTHLAPATHTTKRELLTWAVDINSVHVWKKSLLRLLAEYATNVQDKKHLLYLCSKQGLKAFNQFKAWQPSLLDVLATFASCRPPFNHLVHVLGPLLPRHYSITNTQRECPGQLKIVFNVVERIDERDTSHVHKGQCTGWLEQLAEVGQALCMQVAIFQKPLAHRPFRALDSSHALTTPVILIAAGTGIAPFMGFLQQRKEQMEEAGQSLAPAWLIFGCRDRRLDYLFQGQIQAHVNSGVVDRVDVCTSREMPKRYVQDAMREHRHTLWQWIHDEHAVVYVCGDAKGMAKQVDQAMYEMLEAEAQLTRMDAVQRLAEWNAHGRYLRDVW
jgi:methionine synthase reductase